MYHRNDQEQRLAVLVASCAYERELLKRDVRSLVPRVKRLACLGSAAWTARKALPLLRSLLADHEKRREESPRGRRVAKALGLVAVAATLAALVGAR